MPMTQFDPPGFSEDLTQEQRGQWSEWISQQMTAARERKNPKFKNYGPRHQFFNPLVNAPAADAVEKDVEWTAFPRVVQVSSSGNLQRWQRADASRDNQDEYCEWSVQRDESSGKIVRVAFTSEGPEYWTFLASVNPGKVLQLYQQHVSPAVTHDDLFPGGTYDERNRWNNSTSNGVMHLIQGANTLGAEIELAAGATIVRLKNGQPLTAEQDLIRCGRYGEPQRHSDPSIGAAVNALARTRADITLANPVGLYLAGLSTQGWSTPDGRDPLEFWKVTRGTPAKALRAVFTVPEELNYTVGDIKINNRPIEYGAQIADFITVKLTGLATRLGLSNVQPVEGCVGPALQGDFSPPSVAELLGQRRQGRI